MTPWYINDVQKQISEIAMVCDCVTVTDIMILHGLILLICLSGFAVCGEATVQKTRCKYLDLLKYQM